MGFKRIALVSALLPFVAPASWGLGLGDITMRSFLNEPLRAEVELIDVQDFSTEDIKIRLATQEDFDRIGVERAYFLTSIQFEVVVEGDQSKILLTTEKPLLEPYLDFLIETRWPSGRLLREYTVLVDLPRRSDTERMGSYAKGPEEQGESRASEAIAAQSEPTRELATPAQRPSRKYDADAADSPRAGGRYLVENNDTLWEIAQAARPEGASVEQTMMATLAMNGDAFLGGNINGLKAGYVLELPGDGEILIERDEAQDAVAQQISDWSKGIRREMPLRVVADNEFETEDASDDPDTEDSAFTGGDDDLIAATESGMDDGADADTGYSELVSAGEEASSDGSDPMPPAEPAATSADLAAIEARLGSLADQVDDLRDLVSIKDQQIAALQAELAARDEREAQRAAAQTAAPVQTAQPVAPAPISSGLPWWAYVLGGVVVLGLLGMAGMRWMSRRQALAAVPAAQRDPVPRPTATPAAVPQAPAEPAEPAPASPVSDTPQPEDGERGYGRKLHNDYAEENAVSDAIAEADIYVAYGRYQQALDLLESASTTDPGNAAALLKMLEIYLKNDRREEAEALLGRIEQTGDTRAHSEAMELMQPGPEVKVDLGELADSDVVAPAAEPAPEPEPTPEPVAAPEVMEALEETVAAPLDLELDLEPELDEEVAPLAPETPAADWGELGESVSDTEQRLPPELAEVLGTDEVPDDEVVADEDDSGLIYSVETDPMDTKLDLARAYIDMGDEDGARPVLEEVIAKGDLQQQAEARELLIRIE